VLLRLLQGALAALIALVALVLFADGAPLSAGLTRIRAERELAAGHVAKASDLLANALERSPESPRLLVLQI